MRVALLSPDQRGGERIGESLSPGAASLLRRLGVWEQFLADGHLPCYANKSAWGSARLHYYDFLTSSGHAWHIDRLLFEQRLKERASEVGVQRLRGARLTAFERAGEDWQLQVDGEEVGITARFVIDATGRASWFARRQAAGRQQEDRQIAMVMFLRPRTAALTDTTSLVESEESGWWYSAVLPDGRLIVAFMTDPDLHTRQALTEENGLALLRRTHHTWRRVVQGDFVLPAAHSLTAASSGRLDRFTGTGWLAVGDAALCYDPLSSHGLTVAMQSALDAADAVCDLVGGNDLAGIAAYCARLEAAYTSYLAMRRSLYAQERRWPNAAFWTRRSDQPV
jgi:2-polyprenyl-6-methoxyphenol hydroxylase-like FAD-dependent oxidoreductase